MTDLAIAWDAENARGDWQMDGPSLALGNDLETAILVSLFTDRVAAPGYVPTDGTNDPRGWWADSYTGDPIGSRLWQLDRAIKSNSTKTLRTAELYCREALQWLVSDNIVTAFTVNAWWVTPTRLGIRIVVTQPPGTTQTFQYSWAWSNA